jgi:hypothetical protein
MPANAGIQVHFQFTIKNRPGFRLESPEPSKGGNGGSKSRLPVTNSKARLGAKGPSVDTQLTSVDRVESPPVVILRRADPHPKVEKAGFTAEARRLRGKYFLVDLATRIAVAEPEPREQSFSTKRTEDTKVFVECASRTGQFVMLAKASRLVRGNELRQRWIPAKSMAGMTEWRENRLQVYRFGILKLFGF